MGRIARIGPVMDLDADVLESRVALGERQGLVAQRRPGARVFTVRQKAHRRPEGQEPARRPIRLRRQPAQQRACPLCIVLGLKGAAIITRPAQDPAVVGGEEELFDEDLHQGLGVQRARREHGRVEIRQDVGDVIAAGLEALRLGRPFPVLITTAVPVAATRRACRQDATVLAEPADGDEWAASGRLHVLDPAAQNAGLGELRRPGDRVEKEQQQPQACWSHERGL